MRFTLLGNIKLKNSMFVWKVTKEMPIQGNLLSWRESHELFVILKGAIIKLWVPFFSGSCSLFLSGLAK